MEEQLTCPDCGTALPSGAPEGFCPRCLMGSETLGSTTGRIEFEPPSASELDRLLPEIEITEFIGRGGMGAVYKGRQPRLDRTVAVKVLPPLADEDERSAFDERFEREAQTMAKLDHPHIVGVHDFGETADEMLYIVMEYVDGTDLATLILAGELEPAHFLRWVPQICEALENAHASGIVHRDIKPSNILITADGSGVKVADFGIARLAGEDAPFERMTMTDTVLGTPDYVAPEQLEGGSTVDHRADIYSLGVMIYEMLTGKVPYGDWTPPSKSRPSEPVTREFDPIVQRAMRKKPDDRYQRATHMREDVQKITPRPEARVKANRRLWIPIAAAVVLICGMAYKFWPGKTEEAAPAPKPVLAPLMHSPRQPTLRYATRESEHPFGMTFYQDRVYGARTHPVGLIAMTAFSNIQVSDPEPGGWFAPAMANFGDILWCAYKSKGEGDHSTSPIVAGYYEEGIWGTLKLAPPSWDCATTHAPAMQTHGGHLFLAFRKSDSLIGLLRIDRPDDFSYAEHLQPRSIGGRPMQTTSGPVLASSVGRLWLAFALETEMIGLASSENGKTWEGGLPAMLTNTQHGIRIHPGTAPAIAAVDDRLYMIYVRSEGGIGYAVAKTDNGKHSDQLDWIPLPPPSPEIISGIQQPSLAWAGGQDLAFSVSDGKEVVMTQLETGPVP